MLVCERRLFRPVETAAPGSPGLSHPALSPGSEGCLCSLRGTAVSRPPAAVGTKNSKRAKQGTLGHAKGGHAGRKAEENRASSTSKMRISQ